MHHWVDAVDISEVPTGQWKTLELENQSILLINYKGQYYAIENRCTHDDGTLSDGELEGDEIICPRHGARFCIKTGEVTEPPAYEDIESYPVRVQDNKIQILI